MARPRKEDSEGKVTVLDGVNWELVGTGASPKTMWFDRTTGDKPTLAIVPSMRATRLVRPGACSGW